MAVDLKSLFSLVRSRSPARELVPPGMTRVVIKRRFRKGSTVDLLYWGKMGVWMYLC
jgi:hypothetical protein